MELTELLNLATGESRSFTAHGQTFRVKRLPRNVWHLSCASIKDRSRFGTRAEIAEDVQYALDYGVLVPPSGPRW